MGLFDRVEHRLERAVNSVFSRAFKSEVVPVEIASAIRRAMDDKAALRAQGVNHVPNHFTIDLSPGDYERLTAYADELTHELIAAAEEHAETHYYQPGGPFHMEFRESDSLETGVFAVRPSTVGQRQTPPRPAPRPEPSPDEFDDFFDDVDPDEPTTRQPPPTPAPAPAAPAHLPRRRATQRPWLDIDGDRYPLLSAISIIGRDNTADIILDDPGISRRHSELRVTTDGPHFVATLIDLRSTNGTYVNGERITHQRLLDDDQVTVGRTTMTYHAGRA